MTDVTQQLTFDTAKNLNQYVSIFFLKNTLIVKSSFQALGIDCVSEAMTRAPTQLLDVVKTYNSI